MSSERLGEGIGKRLENDGLETHQPDVAERGGQSAGVGELRSGGAVTAARHRFAGVNQDAHRDAWLGPEELEEETLQPHVGAPVDGSHVVALLEMAVVQELVPDSGETRDDISSDPALERLAPADGQALETLESLPAQQLRRSAHGFSVAIAPDRRKRPNGPP